MTRSYAWGVDIGASRIAIAFLPGGVTRVLELPQPTPKPDKRAPAERLALAYTSIGLWAQSLASEFPPLCVWIEQPMGKFRNAILDYMTAITHASLYAYLGALYPYPVSVFQITISEWKERAVGSGKAEKTDVREWALRSGFSPATQDEADALGIATGGLALQT